MIQFHIDSDNGSIILGPCRVGWYNVEDGEPGFFILGIGQYNLEFGQVDQDRPGIYLTRYDNADVHPVFTLLRL